MKIKPTGLLLAGIALFLTLTISFGSIVLLTRILFFGQDFREALRYCLDHGAVTLMTAAGYGLVWSLDRLGVFPFSYALFIYPAIYAGLIALVALGAIPPLFRGP